MGIWAADRQPWTRVALGPALVALGILFIEGVSRFVVRIPNPPAFLILVVAYSAFRGGLRTGLAAAIVAWGYFVIAFSGDTLFQYTADDFKRVIIWGAMTPALALMIGTLRSRLLAAERQAILEAKNQFTRAFHASPVGVVLTSPTDPRVLDANQVAAEILGYEVDELRGQPAEVLWFDPSQRAALVDRIGSEGAVRAVDVVARTKQGSRVHLLVSMEMLGAGEDARFLMFFIDQTERREVEAALARRAQQLQTAQRMEAIGRLAGGIAHDFNNLLTVISANATMLGSGDPAEDRELAADITEAAARAATLTRQLLSFSRQEAVQPVPLDVGMAIEKLRSFLTRTIGETIELRTELEPHRIVRADPGQIDQIITNLAINARDAMPEGGVLTLEVAAVELDAEATQLGTDARPGEFVRLTVRDTGVGIDAEVRDHIFEPFFTTKDDLRGTGLGLATVYAIVSRAQGFITVDSDPGRGSTFRVHLPRERDAETENAAHSPKPDRGRNEVVLLIEDDRAVRDAVHRMLSALGYHVLVAEGPEAAIELARAHAKPIDVIVTDVVMPRMSGREVVEQLAPLIPAAKVLFISGYANDPGLLESIRARAVAFLPKPFSAEALAAKLAELLSGP